MSRTNLELVHYAYECLAAPGGLEELTKLAAPEFKVDLSDVMPERAVFHTIEDFLRFREPSPWAKGLDLEPERFHEVDDTRILVDVRVRGTGRASGIDVEADRAHVWELRDGLFTLFKVYASPEAARRAVGFDG